MYGQSPSGDLRVDNRFMPILELRSAVGRRFTLHRGEGVAYGWSYIAEHDEEVADVPVGYADGLPRQLANAGWFVVRGERAPIRGRVCMDQTIISVPEDAREGDVVTVYGGQSGMTLDSIGELSGTNNYEIATRLMARVPRIFLRDGRPVAWEHLLLGERGVCDGHVDGVEESLDAVPVHQIG
jgi:alanine racemase